MNRTKEILATIELPTLPCGNKAFRCDADPNHFQKMSELQSQYPNAEIDGNVHEGYTFFQWVYEATAEPTVGDDDQGLVPLTDAQLVDVIQWMQLENQMLEDSDQSLEPTVHLTDNTPITATNPVVSLPSLTSLDCVEITVEVRISYKTVKVITPLSDDDVDTYRFLEGGNSNTLQGFVHSVASTWLSKNMTYNCNIIDFHISNVSYLGERNLSPIYELPIPSSEPIRYNLHTVDIVEEDGMPSYTLEYLCDDADWAHAVIHFHHGRHLGCDVSLNNKRYYRGIENDHPNAKIIPSMRKETREDIMSLR